MTAIGERRSDVGTLPLTDSQKGLLVLDRQIPARHLYNLTYEIELSTNPDPQRLKAALECVSVIQPALRMVFHETHAEFTEPVAPADFPFEAHELTDDALVGATVDRLGGLRFDLANGPLYHLAYLRSPTRAVLVFVVSHLVFCHFSTRPFLEDLESVLAAPRSDADIGALRAARERMLAAELAVQARIAGEEATRVQALELADRLRDATPTTLYPHPDRPAQTRFLGTRLTWEIHGAEAEAVRSACRTIGITTYDFFMAVFGATVGRHSASTDVTIGNVFFTRRTAGSLGLAGFFVNTLPVNLKLDWAGSFADFTKSSVQPAIEYTRGRARVAFNQLVEVLNPERIGNRNPVFSCLMAMYDEPEWPGIVTAVRSHGNHTAKFDLWLGVTPLGDGWRLELEYDRELFPASVGAEIQKSLRSAIRGAATDGPVAVADLFADASAAESAETDGHRAEPPTPSLVTWIEETATRHSGKAAIADGDREVSYAELHAAVSRAAGALPGLGVRPGDVVGLRLDNLVDTVTAMLAVMRAGAAFLPLDGDLPAERLEYMVAKSGCRLVIGGADVAGTKRVSVADLASGQPGPPVVAGRAASYVMFTSGSTGRPKGIHMAESALHNLTAWQLAALGMGPGTRFMQYAPLGFDVSFQEIVPTLCAGGTVVSRRPAARQDFPALLDRVRQAEVTHLYLPVAALRPFAQAVFDAGVHLDHLTHLCVSGEQLVIDAEIRRLSDAHPHLRLVNLYGPTETHAVITKQMHPPAAGWPGHAPIGRPMTGVAAYVVDVTGHLAPTGVLGELHLGGACPAFGYINDPEKTGNAFLPDRFAHTGTMYRTGDLVLREDSADLIFLGRNDDQVKIRGYRVELGDIEAAARAVDGVRHAVAAARKTAAGLEIVLFAVTEDVTGPDLRTVLRQVLPGYMVPANVQLVDAIPATDNGKVDRAALLRNAAETTAGPGGEVAYENDLERELAAIWVELLGVTAIERDRSLLEYGAHSIMMFNSISQINKNYGITLSIGDLFGALTIAELAEKVQELRAG